MQDIFDNLKHCLVSREKRVLVALQEIPSILFIANRPVDETKEALPAEKVEIYPVSDVLMWPIPESYYPSIDLEVLVWVIP